MTVGVKKSYMMRKGLLALFITLFYFLSPFNISAYGAIKPISSRNVALVMPGAWQIYVKPPKNNLVYYVGTNLPILKGTHLKSPSPLAEEFLKLLGGSPIGGSVSLVKIEDSNLVYMPTAIWPSEFTESDFPNAGILPLPASLNDYAKSDIRTSTILSSWLKLRLFLFKNKIIGAQAYHNQTKLMDWQDSFYIHNVNYGIIPISSLKFDSEKNKFFSNIPKKEYSVNIFGLAKSVYNLDFKHQGQTVSTDNLINALGDDGLIDIELLAYLLLFHTETINMDTNSINARNSYPLCFQRLNQSKALVYNALFDTIHEKMKSMKGEDIQITRKEVYANMHKNQNLYLDGNPIEKCLSREDE